MKLFVMIPAYNEERTIAKVIQEIPRKIEGIDEVKVLVINDGSTDNTAKVAKEAGATVISHKYNKGVGFAFKTGIDYSISEGANIIVNMDGDGQFNPKDIPKLIKPILEGYDFVTCTRFTGNMKGKMPFIKYVGNKIFSKVISFLIRQKFTDTQCGFRAYSREAALRLTVYGKYTYTQEVFIDLAFKNLSMKEVPCSVLAERQHGKSRVLNKGIINYIIRSLKIVLRAYRDYRPLYFFGFPSTIILFIGILFGIGSFIYWLLNHQTSPVRTYLWLSIFFTLSGLIGLTIAILADMFGRIRKNQEEILYRLKKAELNKNVN